MDHEQQSGSRPSDRDRNTANSSHTSASARQAARNKGLAWVSAITLGAGAAGGLGALAIAIALPSPTAATSTPASQGAVTSTSASEEGDDDSGSTQQAAPLQAAQAPANTNIPPAATTGAS